MREQHSIRGLSLSYDFTVDQYIYVWKTDKAWKDTCGQLIVKLNDGTTSRGELPVQVRSPHRAGHNGRKHSFRSELSARLNRRGSA